MRIAFVAMPWPMFDSPCTSIGALSAFVRRERPAHQVTSIYAYVHLWQALESLYERLCSSPLAELLFVPQLYPEMTEAVRERFDKILLTESPSRAGTELPEQLATYFDATQKACTALVDGVTTQLVGKADLIGFSTTYSQVFGSLAVAQQLKAKDANCRIVLGGAGVDGECGRSLIAHYDCVDYVVQGEGERPLLRLIDELADGNKIVSSPGLLATDDLPDGASGECFSQQQRLEAQVADLDELPLPDYREYAQLADQLNIYWHLPVESSRGCWWNRTMTTGDPLKACYFCSLNTGSYREKSTGRVATEINTLVKQYGNARLRFMDNVVRRKGLPEMLDAVDDLGLDLRFLAEVRASLSPYELLRLKESGCHHVQIGVEGLSTSYLQRIGKGTTTILNLQALKTCADLELESASNLLIDFPGATEQEVQETAHCILNYAIAYHPMNVSYYRLGYGSSVQALPEHFGITNLRNAKLWGGALPDEVASALRLQRIEYDCDTKADWSSVVEAVEKWKRFKQDLPRNRTFSDRPLFYTDGGSFLEIVDRRDGFRLIALEGIWREVYLYCLGIRKHRDIQERFREHPEASELEDVLAGFIREKLMFSERGQYLSLALAVTPHVAAKRLRRGDG